VLVKHLDDASSHSHYSHPVFKYHTGSESSFFEEDYDEFDEFDVYGDEYYESDDEVAIYLSVIFFFHFKIISLLVSCLFSEIFSKTF
jgi:hypothetical protein